MNTQYLSNHSARMFRTAHLFAAVLFAVILLTLSAGHSSAYAATSQTILTFNQSVINQIGKQGQSSVACLDYCYAYAESIVDGQYHSWAEYDYYGGAYGEDGACARLVNGYSYDGCGGSADDLRKLYDAINAGHPVIAQVGTPYTSWHWVVVVGYQDVTDPNNLRLEQFLALDPAHFSPSEPTAMSGYYFLHSDNYDDLRISTRSASINSIVDEGAITRLSGNDRYSTMSVLVSEGFSSGSCKTAVLATGESFPDALAASSLAGVYNAPVILTQSDRLTTQAQEQLSRLGVQEVYVLGGTNSVREEVISTLNSMGISTQRVAGASRQETSVQIFTRVLGVNAACDTVIIAAGNSFADALSISPYAYAKRTPILLTNGEGMLTQEEVDAIKGAANIKNVVIVGGTNSVSEDIRSQLGDYEYTRLSGNDRYATSAAIAYWELTHGMSVSSAAVATGRNYPDALAGAALCGVKNSVLLLADDGASSSACGVLNANSSGVSTCYVFGGRNSVSSVVAAACSNAAFS